MLELLLLILFFLDLILKYGGVQPVLNVYYGRVLVLFRLLLHALELFFVQKHGKLLLKALLGVQLHFPSTFDGRLPKTLRLLRVPMSFERRISLSELLL